MINAGCYLGGRTACHAQISAEHIVSKSILSQFDPKAVYIEGLPWCRNLRRIGIASITGRVLCRTHNSSLSPCDIAAGKFFRCIRMVRARFDEDDSREECIIDGRNLEKWMLKTMCTLLVSGNASRDGKLVRSPLNPEWLDILVGYSEMKPGWGLYLERPTNNKTEMNDQLTLRLNWLEDLCVGISASFVGFVIHLFPVDISHPPHQLYRPGGLIFERNGIEKVLAIYYGTLECGQAPIIQV